MGSLRAGFVLSAALIMAVAGCSSQEPGSAIGTATPTGTSTPTTTSKTSAPKTTVSRAFDWPARPKTLDTTGANPCDVLKQVPADLEVMARGEPTFKDSLLFKGSKECIGGSTAKSYTVSLTMPPVSAKEYATSSMGAVGQTTVAGFPGFTLTKGEGLGACFIGIDVADKQMVYLQWSDNKPGQKPPSEQLCANLSKVGAAVLKALGA